MQISNLACLATARRTRLACFAVVSVALIAGCQDFSARNSSQNTTTSGQKTSGGTTYSVTFSVRSDAGKLGAVQFDARPKSGIQWRGSGDKVACTSLIQDSMVACNEKGGGLLSCGMINVNGFAVPADLLRCEVEASGPVSAGDFTINVVDSTDPATKAAPATIVVSNVKQQ